MSVRERWSIVVPPASEAGPWPLLVEVARALPAGSWSIVGGMMVQLHALHAGIRHGRATDDVDALLHIETGAISYPRAAHTLEQLGFTGRRSLARDAAQHRFVRGTDAVDLLVADHTAPSVLQARATPHAVRTPGGTRALRHTIDATITVADETVEVSLPDEFGALVLKSRAYFADHRDRGRHLDDLGTLLAAQPDPPTVIAECNAANTETRARISAALHAMRQKRGHEPRLQLALDEYELGLLGEADRARERY